MSERYLAVPTLNLTRSKPSAALQAMFRLMIVGSMAAVVSTTFLGTNAAQADDVLKITLNKTSMLRFDVPIKSVIVGQAQIADVTIESRRLLLVTGKSAGETNLTILGKLGREIASFDLVVAPESERHVTIHRAADTVATYSCMPRCTVVKSPDDAESSTKAPASVEDSILEGADGGATPAASKPKDPGSASKSQ